MRFVLERLCVCAFALVPLVGCFDLGPIMEDCDPERCAGVVCDDGNECTYEYCYCGACIGPSNVEDGTECTFDGTAGVCVDGVCGENLCEDVECDDGLDCTDDTCVYADGSCEFTNNCNDDDSCTRDVCDPTSGVCRFPPEEDGEACFPAEGVGICESGVCVGACDPASEEVTQCPVVEELFCCPGQERCQAECLDG